MRAVIALAALLAAAACGPKNSSEPIATTTTTSTVPRSPPTAATTAPTTAATTTATTATTTAATIADLDFCVSETNRYRAMVGSAPVQRSSALENFAARAAQSDGETHDGHGYVRATNFGDGLVRGENELTWWPLAPYGTVVAVMANGIAAMWGEGPDGGHYQNIANPAFSEIGCGVYISNGEITVVQDFR